MFLCAGCMQDTWKNFKINVCSQTPFFEVQSPSSPDLSPLDFSVVTLKIYSLIGSNWKCTACFMVVIPFKISPRPSEVSICALIQVEYIFKHLLWIVEVNNNNPTVMKFRTYAECIVQVVRKKVIWFKYLLFSLNHNPLISG
jgi:hypothetical protein